MEEWKVGDQVFLRSGGPSMTVITVGDDKLTCMWFNALTGGYNQQTFPVEAVRLAQKG